MLSIQIGRLKLALQFSVGLNMIQQQDKGAQYCNYCRKVHACFSFCVGITAGVHNRDCVPYVPPTLYIAHMIVTKVSICEWANGPFNDKEVKVV